MQGVSKIKLCTYVLHPILCVSHTESALCSRPVGSNRASPRMIFAMNYVPTVDHCQSQIERQSEKESKTPFKGEMLASKGHFAKPRVSSLRSSGCAGDAIAHKYITLASNVKRLSACGTWVMVSASLGTSRWSMEVLRRVRDSGRARSVVTRANSRPIKRPSRHDPQRLPTKVRGGDENEAGLAGSEEWRFCSSGPSLALGRAWSCSPPVPSKLHQQVTSEQPPQAH